MAIIYPVAILNARLQEVVNAIDGGPGNGLLKIGTAGMALVLCGFTLAKPSATIFNGVLTFAGTPFSTFGINSGAAASAQLTDSTGTIVASGLTVGLAGTDIVISQSVINLGDTVSFLAGAITGV